MELFIEVSGFLRYEKKVMKIRNFELSINKYNEVKKTLTEEMICHIKYISTKDRNGNKITIERKDNQEKYQIKTNSVQDMEILLSSILAEQEKYKIFIKDYYTDNNSYNLIEGDSFFDYFTKVNEFLTEVNKNLEAIKINPGLEYLLDMINSLLEKIDYYLKVIEDNENDLKEKNEELFKNSQEIKELLKELKEAISSCSYGLQKNEINEYIEKFKNIVKDKTYEINTLIDEIKYNLSNYLALKIEDSEENALNEVFGTKDQEMTKLLLENENLKIQTENLYNENQIISQFLIENKTKK